ncbi:hypothetical protein CEN47_12555 [Fischerella thermalis CCMEE 5319]|nr:hypothetical protein CEN47_12555 [Fischerella thermalis CCMEE 5319]
MFYLCNFLTNDYSKMKNTLIFGLAMLVFSTSCKKSDDNNAYDDPLFALTVEEKNFILLTNTYGPNDPASGVAAGLFKVYQDFLPGSVFTLNIPSSNNIAFKPDITDSILITFFKKPPMPALHVNNEYVGLELEEAISEIAQRKPTAGLNHLVTDKGDHYEIRAKVKFFDFIYLTSFYVVSYLLGDFEPKDYGGGINFTTPAVPGVTEVVNGKLSYAVDVKSLRDTSITVIRKGDPVMHYSVLIGTDSIAFAPGILLDTINFFGSSYDAGDIFGLPETPIRFRIPKTTLSEAANKLHVLTLIFRYNPAMGQYVLQNSYQTRIR